MSFSFFLLFSFSFSFSFSRSTSNLRKLNLSGYTVLHGAALTDSAKSAKLLLSYGASLSAKSTYGLETPLLTACKSDSSLGVFRTLLAALKKSKFGDDSSVADHLNNTVNAGRRRAIDIAARNGAEQILSELLKLKVHVGAPRFGRGNKRSNKRSPLCLAAEKGQTSCLNLLIEAGASIDEATGDEELTPIMCAVRFLRLEAVRFLLVSGCDLEASNKGGSSVVNSLQHFLSYRAGKEASTEGEGGVNFVSESKEKSTSKMKLQIKHLIECAVSGWSEKNQETWTGAGREVADLVINGIRPPVTSTSSPSSSIDVIPEEVRKVILSFCQRGDWLARKSRCTYNKQIT